MNSLKETSSLMSFFKIIYVIIVFLIVLGISYYFSKFIGKRVTCKNKLMRHIETISFGNDKSLHIVQVSDKFYLISCSQKGICLLEKLPDNILKNEHYNINSEQEPESFEGYIENVYDNADLNNRLSIKQNIEKFKKIVRGNKTDE